MSSVSSRNPAVIVGHETVLAVRILPIEQKVVDSVSRRLSKENLDLHDYYYSNDLSTRLKKNGWNRFRVAVVNFFTGRYNFETLVNNVNTSYFHIGDAAQRSHARIASLEAKLREKRPDLIASNAPIESAPVIKDPIRLYKDEILFDFLFNCSCFIRDDEVDLPRLVPNTPHRAEALTSSTSQPKLILLNGSVHQISPYTPKADEDVDFFESDLPEPLQWPSPIPTRSSSTSSLSGSLERSPSPVGPSSLSPSKVEASRRKQLFRAVCTPLVEIKSNSASEHADQKQNHIDAANVVIGEFRAERDFLGKNPVASEDAREQLSSYISQLEQAIIEVQGEKSTEIGSAIVGGLSNFASNIADTVGNGISTLQENFNRSPSLPNKEDTNDWFLDATPEDQGVRAKELGIEIVDGLSNVAINIADTVGDGFSALRSFFSSPET